MSQDGIFVLCVTREALDKESQPSYDFKTTNWLNFVNRHASTINGSGFLVLYELALGKVMLVGWLIGWLLACLFGRLLVGQIVG